MVCHKKCLCKITTDCSTFSAKKVGLAVLFSSLSLTFILDDIECLLLVITFQMHCQAFNFTAVSVLNPFV